MSTLNLRLFEFARKEMSLSEEKAKEFVLAIDEVIKEDIKKENLDELATKVFVKNEINRVELKIEQAKSELSKSIYMTGLIQFLAIVGSLVCILSFMLRK